MLRGLFEGPGVWIILVVVLLLFGATRLPALARSIGQSTKILRDEVKSDKTASAPADPAIATPMATDPAASVAPTTAPAAPTTSEETGTPGNTTKS